jgi:hypothetical protein
MVDALNTLLFPVLHPRHKLNYFKNAKWETEWIEDARILVRAEFDRSYNCRSASRNSSSSDKVSIAHLPIF